MSPSAISLMRAPGSRISATRSSCRGRSSTIAVTSATRRPNASAIASRFSPTGRRRSIRPLATGPTAILLHVHARHRHQAAGVAAPPGSRARPGARPPPPCRSRPGRTPGRARRPAARRARGPRAAGAPRRRGRSRACPRRRHGRAHRPSPSDAAWSAACGIAAAEEPAGGERAPLGHRGEVGAAGTAQRPPGRPACAVTASAPAMPCSQGTAAGARGGALEDQVHDREQRLVRVGRLDHRPALLLGPSDQVLLDAADLTEAPQVAVHRPQAARLACRGRRSGAWWRLLVGDRRASPARRRRPRAARP